MKESELLDAKARNPRYAGARVGDVVRSLFRPLERGATSRDEHPAGEPPADESAKDAPDRG